MNTFSSNIYDQGLLRQNNRYIGGLTIDLTMMTSSASRCYPPLPAFKSNLLESFDDDPLTLEERMDLEISCQELVEGKGIEIPAEKSIKNLLDGL